MRLSSVLSASLLLIAGCRYVVSLDGFSDGVSATGAGGAAATGGAGGGGAPVGGSGGSTTTDAGPDVNDVLDAPMFDADAVSDAPPPGLVLTIGGPIRGITVDDSNLYYVVNGNGGGVFRMNKAGGSTAMMHATGTATDVAVDASFVYWSDQNQVFSIPLTGGQLTMPTSLFSLGASQPQYLAVDDQAILYVTTADGLIIKGGLTKPAVVPFPTQDGITGIAFGIVKAADVVERELFWGYNGGLRKGTVNGPDYVDLLMTSGIAPVQGVATDEDSIYWINDSREVLKGSLNSPLELSPRCLDKPQDLGTNPDIAVDKQWIYYTQPLTRQIWKCLKN